MPLPWLAPVPVMTSEAVKERGAALLATRKEERSVRGVALCLQPAGEPLA